MKGELERQIEERKNMMARTNAFNSNAEKVQVDIETTLVRNEKLQEQKHRQKVRESMKIAESLHESTVASQLGRGAGSEGGGTQADAAARAG
jgi:hypothetical protein